MQSDRSTNSDRINLKKSLKNDMKKLENVADLSFISQGKVRLLSPTKSPRK